MLAGFALSDGDGVAVELSERKARALLAYLALNPDRHHERDELTVLLWGDRAPAQARASLSTCLTGLRKAVGNGAEGLFETDLHGVTLRGGIIEVDVARLRRLAESDDFEDLAEAARLYQGELLAGFVTAEAGYEEWLRVERQATRETVAEVLFRLAEGRLAAGDAKSAVEPAEQLAALDPLNERAQRLLMRTYVEAGRRSAALEQYRACKELLEKELGVEPEAETKALEAAIRARDGGGGPDGTAPARRKPTPEVPGVADKPSIAVLPFDNMSGDPEQEYFADGIVEDVITALSRFSSLFVIARNSTFTYKGRAAEITEVGRDLGVQYVVEGSVRKVGDRVRVTAQLIETETGNHVWAERYDRDLEDIFEVQDQITEQIVIAVAPEVEARERERARRKPPGNLDAWELVHRGLSHFYRDSMADRTEAIRLFEEAVALDPDFPAAHCHLAYALCRSVFDGHSEDTAKALASGRAAAERAVSLDPNEPLAHYALGRFHTFAGEIEMAIGEMRAAIAFNPNFAWGHYGLGFAYRYGAGSAEQALPHYDTALRLSPRDPARWVILMMKGTVLRTLGRHDEAIEHCRQACQFPGAGFLPYMHLAASLAEAGQESEAKAAVENAIELEPSFSIGFIRGRFVGVHEASFQNIVDSLRKAGAPE